MDKNAILIRLSESNEMSFVGDVAFDGQTRTKKVFCAIWTVESEVNNGGFAQYFANSSSETAGFVAEALETIGAPRTADICRRAIATAFPVGLPLDAKEISATASDFPAEVEEKLDALDQEFFAYPHNLTELLFEYACKHPQEFGELPEPDA
jgi:Domain of unknown function (DUF4375)